MHFQAWGAGGGRREIPSAVITLHPTHGVLFGELKGMQGVLIDHFDRLLVQRDVSVCQESGGERCTVFSPAAMFVEDACVEAGRVREAWVFLARGSPAGWQVGDRYLMKGVRKVGRVS